MSLYDRTFQTLCLSVQPILKINKQNQAIYTIQQPIKIHLMSPLAIKSEMSYHTYYLST